MTEQGRRSYQEDRYVALIDPIDGGGNSYFLAVMDGHRGDEVSNFAREFLQREVQLTTFDQAQTHLTDVVARLYDATKDSLNGSTISAACVFENDTRILSMVLGDSPVILGKGDELVYLSEEHNVGSNPAERAAAEARGGMCDWMYLYAPPGTAGLQLSRALGNADFGEVLGRTPSFTTLQRPDSGTLIVSSDGFLDPGHGKSEMIAENLIRNAHDAEDVKALSYYRCSMYGPYDDNATALMLKF